MVLTHQITLICCYAAISAIAPKSMQPLLLLSIIIFPRSKLPHVGPHIEVYLMQTLSDVGGCECWMGSYWEGNQQWWVGWHSPNALEAWVWPTDNWILIGYERWYQSKRGDP